jgi:hypothetical protein
VEEQQDLNYNKLKTIANEKKGSDMSTMAKITASNMVTEIQKKKKKKKKEQGEEDASMFLFVKECVNQMVTGEQFYFIRFHILND